MSHVAFKIYAVSVGAGSAMASRTRGVSPNDDNVLLTFVVMATVAIVLVIALKVVIGKGKLPWKF